MNTNNNIQEPIHPFFENEHMIKTTYRLDEETDLVIGIDYNLNKKSYYVYMISTDDMSEWIYCSPITFDFYDGWMLYSLLTQMENKRGYDSVEKHYPLYDKVRAENKKSFDKLFDSL